MTEVRVFPDAAALGAALADEIVVGIDEARVAGSGYVLGCPGGRSARSTYQALARRVVGADLGHVIIAMMDDYVRPSADGGYEHVPAEAHYSCRRFARDEIAEPLDRSAVVGISPDRIWLPDPTDPPAYRRRLETAGGVDLFIVASGASDGHVAFVKPGTPIDSDVSVISLAESTRRDNMATFPEFTSIDDVPTHGVSVGLDTIISTSRRVRLVIHGSNKRIAAQRVLAASDFDPDWPATFIHRCREAQIWLDIAAHPDGDAEVISVQDRDEE
jgi:glucosamine-6-phosphate deaminase